MFKLSWTTFTTISLLLVLMIACTNICWPAHAATLAVTPMPWMFYSASPANSEPAQQEEPKVESTNPEAKLEALAKHDLVILVDRSASMETVDCPSSTSCGTNLASESNCSEQSRWQWCCEQTQNLSEQTKTVLKDGIKIVVFSSLQKVYDNVKLEYVAGIFKSNQPRGSTNIAPALKSQLDSYFWRKSRPEESKSPLKPLLIAVITDGCFDHSIPIQRAITDATHRMDSSDEIAITFLQVGHDQKASRTLNDLDAGLGVISRKASFDIVSSKPFSELNKVGLTDALLELVSADISR